VRDALSRLEGAVSAMTAEGAAVAHVGSILMPSDQVVFSLIVAGDESLVRQVNDRAGLQVDRIARAIALPGPGVLPGGPAGFPMPDPMDRTRRHEPGS
jgi:hypothetical protein